MGRLRVVLVAAAVGVVPAVALGCGESAAVPDSEIVSALDLERSPGGPAYSIGGDPFCEVSDDLLNDSDEVELAKGGGGLDLVITDPDENVGVEAVPPFDPECARQARRDLERLE